MHSIYNLCTAYAAYAAYAAYTAYAAHTAHTPGTPGYATNAAYKMASDKVSQDFMTKDSNVFFLATHSILSALAGKHYDSFNRPCVVAGGNVRNPIAFSRVSVNHKILHEVQQAFLGLHYFYAGAHWKT